MSNLLNCPCCGGEAILTPPDGMLSWGVECSNPSCQLQGRMSGDRDKAIAAWNRRTPIDHDQIMRDNITTHNTKLRDEQLTSAYRAGYERKPLSINYTDDEHAEYNQGAKDRQRERDEC